MLYCIRVHSLLLFLTSENLLQPQKRTSLTLKRNQFADTNSPWPFRCSYAGLSIGVANFGAKLFGASPIGMHCWAGLQEKTWAYWLSNWKKRWENDHFSLDKEIYEFDGPYSPLPLHSWKFPGLVKLSPHVSHYIDSIITISIQQSESTIYIYLQSMVVRTLWCFMIHWFEKKHSNDLSPEQRERCRVLLVGFSSCVAWWTTMGYESSKRRPEKRDQVSFATRHDEIPEFHVKKNYTLLTFEKEHHLQTCFGSRYVYSHFPGDYI